MKITEELFLKYLSGLLTEKERQEFEKYLDDNLQTQKQFNEFKNRLNSLKYEPEVNEQYFNALVPKVKSQLNKSGKKYFPKFAYIVPVILLLVYFVFNYVNKITNNNKLEKEQITLTLLDDNSELINELFDDFYTNEKISLMDDSLAIVAQQELESSFYEDDIIDSGDDIIENSIFSDYSEYLTEEELNSIFLKLDNKNKL